MLAALTKMEHVNCLAVLVSGNTVFKILGIPQLLKGTSIISSACVTRRNIGTTFNKNGLSAYFLNFYK